MAALAIYSSSGFAREIVGLAEQHLNIVNEMSGDPPDIVFVEDDPRFVGSRVNGWPVISFGDLVSPGHHHRCVAVAVAAPRLRAMIVAKCEAAGLAIESLVGVEHVRYCGATVGEGAICCAYTVIAANTTVGRHFHMNAHAHLSHDCVIGDFVTFAPGVRCGGGAHVEDFVHIGTNAIIQSGDDSVPLRIGAGAVVGMGVIVTRDIPAGAVVRGAPSVS